MDEDLDILPKVDLNDIPEDINFSQPNHRQSEVFPLTSYAAGTNGLVYQQLIMPMPELTLSNLTFCHYIAPVSLKWVLAIEITKKHNFGIPALSVLIRPQLLFAQIAKNYLNFMAISAFPAKV